MICIPGVTLVHFSATSVTKLISIPGEISTNSDACPAIGRNPCDTVAKKDATCGWRLSRKMYERKSAMTRATLAACRIVSTHFVSSRTVNPGSWRNQRLVQRVGGEERGATAGGNDWLGSRADSRTAQIGAGTAPCPWGCFL